MRRGELPRGAELRHLSIVGSEFTGRVVDEVERRRPAGGRHRGRRARAYRTGESTFTLDPDDPLGEGFLLR